MTTGTPPRGGHRARRDEQRSKVLNAALGLAEHTSFRDLTIDEIARAAGISRSAFYLHFRDKHDLLLSAIEAVAGELEQMAGSWWSGEGAPAEQIGRAVEGFVSIYGEHAGVLRVATEVASYDDEVRAVWMDVIGRFIRATSEHLAGEQRRGLVPDRLDATATAEALVWMAERCCYVYLVRPGSAAGDGARGRSPEEVVEQIASVWTAALFPGVIPAAELRPGRSGGSLWGVPAPEFE